MYVFLAGVLAEEINMTHSDMLYRLDISTFYFYELFAVSDFRPLEIYKKLGLSLSTTTFAVNNHADNHFYKYIFLNVIQCEFFI